MRLVLKTRDAAVIRAAARAAYPEECCGLLIGTGDARSGWWVDEVVPTANVATDRRHDRFEVDPAAHLRLHRVLRGSAQRIIGHYHSHPNGSAEPSDIDLAAASDPALLWIIAGVAGAAGPVSLAAYALAQNLERFERVPLAEGGDDLPTQ